MRELVLDGAHWKTRDDVYDAFFAAVGAPSWHGRNFDALNDSISAGQINQIELPYRIVILHFSSISGEARDMAKNFVELIQELNARGDDVEIRIEE